MAAACIRPGIGTRSGTLKLIRPLFGAGLRGRLGDGRQWLSWIGIDDLVDVYHRALWDTELSGPVNAVALEPGPASATAARTGARCRHPFSAITR